LASHTQPGYRRSGHSVRPPYAHLVFVAKYRGRVFNNAMPTGA
jgi:REP element-mobilizing transposase RayT